MNSEDSKDPADTTSSGASIWVFYLDDLIPHIRVTDFTKNGSSFLCFYSVTIQLIENSLSEGLDTLQIVQKIELLQLQWQSLPLNHFLQSPKVKS